MRSASVDNRGDWEIEIAGDPGHFHVASWQMPAGSLERAARKLSTSASTQIFLSDASERAHLAIAAVFTAYAGQWCALGTRAFVSEVHKALVLEQAAKACSRVRIGHADDAEARRGPVISAAQRARCEHFVQRAIERGARVVAEGVRPSFSEATSSNPQRCSWMTPKARPLRTRFLIPWSASPVIFNIH